MSTIHVQLIDAASGTPLGEADLPAEQLPESFATPTTLHLGNSDWQVEHAEPVTREAYVASGRLRLVLRKLERVNPRELLFSLPTLENTLPPHIDGDASHAFVMHEDDWRQHELIASRWQPEIASELAAIRAIHAARVGVGFPHLHVRKHVPEPLSGVELALSEVERALGEVVRRDLAFGGQPGIVEGGFAFVRGDGAVYGLAQDGLVTVLGVKGATTAAALAALASQHALVVVDWCRAIVE
jgi:hypothetical protein